MNRGKTNLVAALSSIIIFGGAEIARGQEILPWAGESLDAPQFDWYLSTSASPWWGGGSYAAGSAHESGVQSHDGQDGVYIIAAASVDAGGMASASASIYTSIYVAEPSVCSFWFRSDMGYPNGNVSASLYYTTGQESLSWTPEWTRRFIDLLPGTNLISFGVYAEAVAQESFGGSSPCLYLDQFRVEPKPAEVLDFTYTTDNGAITITSYTGPSGLVAIPETIDELPVTSIGEGAFSDCARLTSIVMGSNVTSLGNMVFYRCSSLTNVTMGKNVTTIGDYTFAECTSLTNITIPNSATNIGSWAFWNCFLLTSITIPASVTSIGDRAFFGCISLTSITIPTSVTNIGNSVFQACYSLPSIIIPDSVTSIGGIAFGDCTSLTNVTIPNSVTSIGDWAFSGCTSLTSVAIPTSVTSIGDGVFSYCGSLISITVEALNSVYSSTNGVLFNKSQTTLIQYPGGKPESYTIPDSVTSIGDWAFSGCTSLTSVTIGASVISIGEWVFSCPNLVTVYFKGNAPALFGAYVFTSCNNATVYRVADATGWPPVPALWPPAASGRLQTALWDTDADGISDPWEERYFGNPTNADPDAICSNGINTVREAYIAGLNPNDPQSSLRSSVALSGKVFGWNAVSGRVYSVYWTTNLLDGFQCLGTNIPWTRGSFTNSTTGPQGFYKIDVQLDDPSDTQPIEEPPTIWPPPPDRPVTRV